jgi:hypothetical protein
MIRLLKAELMARRIILLIGFGAIIVLNMLVKFFRAGMFDSSTIQALKMGFTIGMIIGFFQIFKEKGRIAMYAILPIKNRNVAMLRISFFLLFYLIFIGTDFISRYFLSLSILDAKTDYLSTIVTISVVIGYLMIYDDVLAIVKDKSSGLIFLIAVPIVFISFMLMIYSFMRSSGLNPDFWFRIPFIIMPVLVLGSSVISYINRRRYIK